MLWKKLLGSLARAGFGMVFGFLLQHKVIESSDFGQYVDEASNWLVMAALATAPIVWAWLKNKAQERQHNHELAVAIHAPADATVADVKAIAKEVK